MTRIIESVENMSPAGRPPLGDEAKAKIIQLRVTAKQKELLDQAAATLGQPTGSWLRDMGLSAAEEIAAAAPKKKSAKKKS